MTTKYVKYCLPYKLPCANASRKEIILCLQSADLIVQPDPPCDLPITTIEGEVCQAYTLCDSCTRIIWHYTFSYDDVQLTSPSTPLVAGDITGVFCKDCETDWIEEQLSCLGGTELCVTDTNSIDLTIYEGCISADSKISLDAGNIISIHSDGLYVPEVEAITCVTDTESIDLTLYENCISADVILSDDAGNELEIRADGLYAPTAGGGGGWALLGDAGTVSTVNFLGTTDNVAHETRVNNLRVRRSEPDPDGPRIIDGCQNNAVDPFPGNSVLSGGAPGAGPFTNGTNYIQEGLYSLVCGGYGNEMFPSASSQGGTVNSGYDTIVGGLQNFLQIETASIGGFNTWDPDGINFIGGGFDNFVICSEYCTIGGGSVNFIDYGPGLIGGVIKAVVNNFAGFDTIAGGEDCYILGYNVGAHGTTTVPDFLGFNFVGGGSGNGLEEGIGCVIAGGMSNSIFPINGTETTPLWNNSILGGSDNLLSTSARSTMGGGALNNIFGNDCSSIFGGYLNRVVNTTGVTLPGFPSNCKIKNPLNAVGVGNVILGGIANKILDGRETSILGGAFLQLGAYSLGYQNAHTRSFTNVNGGERNVCPIAYENPQVDLSAFTDIGYFGDIDLWVANTDGTARKLKFIEPNTDTDFSSANYSSFEAQAQGADINYVLPAAAGVAGNSLKILSVVGTTVTLQWA